MISIILLAVIYLSFICLGLPDSLLGSAWPAIHKDLDIPLHYAGYISMIIAAGRIISSVLSEKIIRRFGTAAVTVISVILLAAALFGYSFSSSLLLLLLCAVPLSLGAGLIDVALNHYVALNYKAKHMSWLHCFWGIGASFGPIIMSFYLMSKNSWSLGYRAIGVIQCILLVVLFSTLSLWEKNKTGIAGDEAKPKDIKYRELFDIPGVKQILAVFFCYCSLQITVVLWGSSFLVTEKNILPETAARWISLYYIGITLGRFISGFITMKLNNRQMIRLGYGVILLGIIALFGGNTLIMSGFFIMGIGCAPVYPCLLHETPANFGNEKSQAIMGIQMACAFLGALLIPPVFGKMTSYTGFNIFPAFLGALLVINVLLFELANRKVDKTRITELQ